MAINLAGRAKPSISTHDDTFVTPQRSCKPKKLVITFSSDEEEDEGECRSTAAFNYLSLFRTAGIRFHS